MSKLPLLLFFCNVALICTWDIADMNAHFINTYDMDYSGKISKVRRKINLPYGVLDVPDTTITDTKKIAMSYSTFRDEFIICVSNSVYSALFLIDQSGTAIKIQKQDFNFLSRNMYTINDTVYVRDHSGKGIISIDLINKEIKTVIKASLMLGTISVFTIYEAEDEIYLFSVESVNKLASIVKTKLSDQNATVIASGLHVPLDLVVDGDNKILYWIEYEGYNKFKLLSCDLDGNNISVHFRRENPRAGPAESITLIKGYILVKFAGEKTLLIYNTTSAVDNEVKNTFKFKYGPLNVVRNPNSPQSYSADDNSVVETNETDETDEIDEIDEKDIGTMVFTPRETVAPPFDNSLLIYKLLLALCLHNGTALPDGEGCECRAPYSGKKCEINNCLNYCLNDGNCTVVNDKMTCVCSSDSFFGDRCDLKVNFTGLLYVALCYYSYAVTVVIAVEIFTVSLFTIRQRINRNRRENARNRYVLPLLALQPPVQEQAAVVAVEATENEVPEVVVETHAAPIEEPTPSTSSDNNLICIISSSVETAYYQPGRLYNQITAHDDRDQLLTLL